MILLCFQHLSPLKAPQRLDRIGCTGYKVGAITIAELGTAAAAGAAARIPKRGCLGTTSPGTFAFPRCNFWSLTWLVQSAERLGLSRHNRHPAARSQASNRLDPAQIHSRGGSVKDTFLWGCIRAGAESREPGDRSKSIPVLGRSPLHGPWCLPHNESAAKTRTEPEVQVWRIPHLMKLR